VKKNASEADDAEGDRDRGRLRTVAGGRNCGHLVFRVADHALVLLRTWATPWQRCCCSGMFIVFPLWVLVMSGYILIEISVRRSTLLRMMQYEMPS
jgi:hypothetical protein